MPKLRIIETSDKRYIVQQKKSIFGKWLNYYINHNFFTSNMTDLDLIQKCHEDQYFPNVDLASKYLLQEYEKLTMHKNRGSFNVVSELDTFWA